MTNQAKIPLTALPRELSAMTGKEPPSYRKLWQMTVDGRLPAEQVNGRYQVARDDLPMIAASLGMTAGPTPQVAKRNRRSGNPSQAAA